MLDSHFRELERLLPLCAMLRTSFSKPVPRRLPPHPPPSISSPRPLRIPPGQPKKGGVGVPVVHLFSECVFVGLWGPQREAKIIQKGQFCRKNKPSTAGLFFLGPWSSQKALSDSLFFLKKPFVLLYGSEKGLSPLEVVFWCMLVPIRS